MTNAWQWDGSAESARAISAAVGKKMRLLVGVEDPTRRYLETPFGTRGWLLDPGDWLVRCPDGGIHAVTADLFKTIKEAP